MELIFISKHYSKIDNQKSSKWLNMNDIERGIYNKHTTKKLTDEELHRFDKLVKKKQSNLNKKGDYPY